MPPTRIGPLGTRKTVRVAKSAFRFRERASPSIFWNQIKAIGVTGSSSGHYQLRLYVAGESLLSRRALSNLRAICERYLANRYTLDVVDILVHRDRPLKDGVFVTPTLRKLSPKPLAQAVGDLSDRAAVLALLDIDPHDQTQGPTLRE